MKLIKFFVFILIFVFALSVNAQNKPDKTYEVKKGDCLSRISKKEYNDYKLWPAIWEKNKNGVMNKDKMEKEKYKTIPNPNLIFIGQVLAIPGVPVVSPELQKTAYKEMKSHWRKHHHKKKDVTTENKDLKKEVKKDEKKEKVIDEKKKETKQDMKKKDEKKPDEKKK
jgi:LysM repeat protein